MRTVAVSASVLSVLSFLSVWSVCLSGLSVWSFLSVCLSKSRLLVAQLDLSYSCTVPSRQNTGKRTNSRQSGGGGAEIGSSVMLGRPSANHLVDRIQPPCTLVDKIQPACTLVDQQDTIFLAQDARLRPVLQSHSSLWGISRIRSFWFRMQNQFQYFKSSIRLSVLVLLLHLRTIRSLRTIYGKFTGTYTDFEHV